MKDLEGIVTLGRGWTCVDIGGFDLFGLITRCKSHLAGCARGFDSLGLKTIYLRVSWTRPQNHGQRVSVLGHKTGGEWCAGQCKSEDAPSRNLHRGESKS